MHGYLYPRPMVTVDILLFQISTHPARVLLIRRKNEPFRGKWAIPGGFLDPEERLEECARRELEEETHLKGVDLIRTTVHDQPGRDPRGRTITVVYAGLVSNTPVIQAGDDAEDAGWFFINHLPDMAFDHEDIIRENALFMFRKILLEGYGQELFTLPDRKNPVQYLSEMFGIRNTRLPRSHFLNFMQ